MQQAAKLERAMREQFPEQEKAAQAEGAGGCARVEVIGVHDLAGLIALL